MKLRNEMEALEELGVGIIAVSTEDQAGLAKGKSKTGATFPFIGDQRGDLLQAFGLLHVGGHPFDKSDIARPANVLVRQDGTVAWASYTENYRVRPKPKRTLAAVRESMGG